jgi:hypothetical protein
MSVRYDNPSTEEILIEQADVLPNGLLGTLIPPKVEMIDDLPEEYLHILRDFHDGRIGSFEMVQRMEAAKAQSGQKILVK